MAPVPIPMVPKRAISLKSRCMRDIRTGRLSARKLSGDPLTKLGIDKRPKAREWADSRFRFLFCSTLSSITRLLCLDNTNEYATQETGGGPSQLPTRGCATFFGRQLSQYACQGCREFGAHHGRRRSAMWAACGCREAPSSLEAD